MPKRAVAWCGVWCVQGAGANLDQFAQKGGGDPVSGDT